MKANSLLWFLAGAGVLLFAVVIQWLPSSYAAGPGVKTGVIPVQVKQAQHL